MDPWDITRIFQQALEIIIIFYMFRNNEICELYFDNKLETPNLHKLSILQIIMFSII